MPDFDMSPYGVFVWAAYGVSAVVLGGLAARIWSAARRARRDLERAERER